MFQACAVVADWPGKLVAAHSPNAMIKADLLLICIVFPLSAGIFHRRMPGVILFATNGPNSR
jgi:hypothetical protein